jgi:hypothetical protein
MSDLTTAEKRKLERLFEMGSGYVLNFSNRTMADFIEEHTGRDVYAKDYPQRGTGSKAWKLRTFWEVEPNHLCGKLISALIDYRVELLSEHEAEGGGFLDVNRLPDEERLVEECRHRRAAVAGRCGCRNRFHRRPGPRARLRGGRKARPRPRVIEQEGADGPCGGRTSRNGANRRVGPATGADARETMSTLTFGSDRAGT